MDKEQADNLRLEMDEQDSMSAPPSPEPTIWQVRTGIEIPYGTFVPTRCKPSKAYPDKGIRGMEGGDGLYSTTRITPFSWLGLYPGRVCDHLGSTRLEHTMRSAGGNFIVADPRSLGVHLIREVPRDGKTAPNVWYVKLPNGYILYFASRTIAADEELITSKSRSYGKRCYPTRADSQKSRELTRCVGADGRVETPMLDEWRLALIENHSDSFEMPPDFIEGWPGSHSVYMSENLGLETINARYGERGKIYVNGLAEASDCFEGHAGLSPIFKNR